MPSMEFIIQSPASTANFGPGFDCLSAALDITNKISVTVNESAHFNISHFILDESRNPVSIAMERDLTIAGVIDCLGVLGMSLFEDAVPVKKENVESYRYELREVLKGLDIQTFKADIDLRSEIDIPFSRGMGSSTAAYCSGILAGLAAFCRSSYLDRLIDVKKQCLKEEVQNFIAHLCIAKEGHPDNAIACAYGGAQSILNDDIKPKDGLGKPCFSIRINPSIQSRIIIPKKETSTEAARAVMPMEYPKNTAIQALRNVLTCINGLEQGDIKMIKSAFDQEGLHVPFRIKLNPHLPLLKKFIADQTPLMTCTLSGSGSTLLVLGETQSDLECLEIFIESLGEGDMVARQEAVGMGGGGVRFGC